MKSMTSFCLVILGAGALAFAGCAHAVPMELAQARAACQSAGNGQAAQLVPADLHKAEMQLAKAEKSFKRNPDSFQTRDLAYVAQRKCQMADALGSIAADQGTSTRARADFSAAQGEIVKQTKADLARQGEIAKQTEADLGRTRSELREARAALMAALAKLAAVKEDERGLVITLSGSVLFRSDESTLLAEAQTRLNQVAEALLANRARSLVVEGHTDSQGSDADNQSLSQRRADSVRGYLIGRGYAADHIVAQGMGEGRPVADNGTPEGRSNNRRVEIIIQRDVAGL